MRARWTELAAVVAVLATAGIAMAWDTGGWWGDVRAPGGVVTTLTVRGNITRSAATGITADPNQAQGDNPITTDLIQVDTVASPGDVCGTLPPAAAGLLITVVNSGGDQCDVFPALGDQINALGVNVATQVPTESSSSFYGIDADSWAETGGGAIPDPITVNQWQPTSGTATVDGDLELSTNDGPCLLDQSAAGSTPNILPRCNDKNTGITSDDPDELDLVAGGQTFIQFDEGGTDWISAIVANLRFQSGGNITTTAGDLFLDPAGIVLLGANLDLNGLHRLTMDADGDTEIYALNDDNIRFRMSGNERLQIINVSGAFALRGMGDGGGVWFKASSATVPTLLPNMQSQTMGIGGNPFAGTYLSLIDASTEVVRVDSAAVTINADHTMYGEAYLDAGSQAAGITTQNQWEQTLGCTAGDLRGFTESACTLTTVDAGTDGTHILSYSVSGVGGAGKDYELGVSIDDVIQAGCRSERTMAATATQGNVGGTCILDLVHPDAVKLEIRCTDAATAEFTYSNINLTIHKI